MASTMVTVLPVPGLEGGLDEDSSRVGAKYVRAEYTERRRARRKLKDGCNRLELRLIGCDVWVVNHSPHPGSARTSDRIDVFRSGEQDSVLLEYGIHRLMLPAKWIPVQPKPNRKPLLGVRHSKRSVKAQANFVLPNNVDISFEPSCPSLWLDDYGVAWRAESVEGVPDFPVNLPLRTLGRFSASPGTSKLDIF